MLYAYINGLYADVVSAKIDRKIGVVGNVQLRLYAGKVLQPTATYTGLNYTLYYGATALVTDGIIESMIPVVDNGQVILYFDVKGTDELGQLLQYPARSNAKYQDEVSIYILDYLLTAAGWEIGRFGGFDETEKTTLNLLDNDTLFSQVKTLLDNTQTPLFRYGGLVNGVHRLDVGTLEDLSGFSFYDGQNTTSIRKPPPGKRLLYEIEGFGGQAGTREVYLSDAADYDPTLLAHAEYPIVNLSDGTWIVRDVVNGVGGGRVLKRYDDVAPTDVETPSTPDIEAAGYTLWKKCVNELTKTNAQQQVYELEAEGTPDITTPPIADIEGLIETITFGVTQTNTTAIGTNPTQFWFAQSFTVPKVRRIYKFTCLIGNSGGTPTGGIVWELRTNSGVVPSSVILDTGIFSPVVLSNNTIFCNSQIALYPGVTYWLLFRPQNIQAASTFWRMRYDSGNPYANGMAKTSSTGGATWITTTTNDMMATLITVPIIDVSALASETAFWRLKPGQVIHLTGRVKIPVLNVYTLEWQDIPIIDIDTTQPLAEWSLDFTDTRELKFTARTGLQTQEEIYDTDAVVIAEKIKGKKHQPVGVAYATPVSLGVTTGSHTQSGVEPNATFSDGRDARLFSIALPAVPFGSTTVRFGFYASLAAAEIEVIQSPALPTTGFICRITIGTGWNVTRNCSLFGVFIFS